MKLFNHFHIKKVSLTSIIRGVDDVVCIIHFSSNFIRDWHLGTNCRARDSYYYQYFVTRSKSMTTLLPLHALWRRNQPIAIVALSELLEDHKHLDQTPSKPSSQLFPFFKAVHSHCGLMFYAKVMSLGTGHNMFYPKRFQGLNSLDRILVIVSVF